MVISRIGDEQIPRLIPREADWADEQGVVEDPPHTTLGRCPVCADGSVVLREAQDERARGQADCREWPKRQRVRCSPYAGSRRQQHTQPSLAAGAQGASRRRAEWLGAADTSCACGGHGGVPPTPAQRITSPGRERPIALA